MAVQYMDSEITPEAYLEWAEEQYSEFRSAAIPSSRQGGFSRLSFGATISGKFKVECSDELLYAGNCFDQAMKIYNERLSS
jgi:hypothetical protein